MRTFRQNTEARAEEGGRIDDLVRAASAGEEGARRMAAVTALKAATLRRADVLALVETARGAEDPGWRATAAQVLGFHLAAVTFREIVPELQALVPGERDPGARRALAFALRETAGAAALLTCGDPRAAVEAVAGVPVTRAAWDAMLEVYFSGAGVSVDVSKEDARVRASGALESAILARVGQAPEAAAWAVAFLMTVRFPESAGNPSDRAARLFAELNDAALLDALLCAPAAVARTHAGIWPGLARRERRQALIEILVEGMRQRGMSPSLARSLVDRIAKGDAFWEGQTRIARLILSAAGKDGAKVMIGAAGPVFAKADRVGKRRLVEAMVELGKAVPEAMRDVERLLAGWEGEAPGAAMRARQARLVRG